MKLNDRFLYLASFLLPALFRLIPEVLAGPYPIGYDTMQYAVGLKDFSMWLRWRPSTPPLLLVLFTPISWAIGPLATMKVAPILLYGCFGVGAYYFARASLRRDKAWSFIAVALLALQPATLRVSWDLHRNMLATIFLLFLIPQMRRTDSLKGFLTTGILSVAVIASHELAIAILSFIEISVLLHLTYARESRKALTLVLATLPLLLIATVSGLANLNMLSGGWTPRYVRVISNQSSNYPLLLDDVPTYFMFCYLLTFPLALCGLNRNLELAAWSAITLYGSFDWLIIPQYSFASNWIRWILMLTFPLSFYAANGVARLARLIEGSKIKLNGKRITTLKLALTLILLTPFAYLTVGWSTQPPERPLQYFSNPRIWSLGPDRMGFPSSALSNTVPISDNPDVVKILKQLNAEMNSSSVLLTHDAFYKWALLTLEPDRIVVPFSQDASSTAAQLSSRGFRQIYLIWWVRGTGWHGWDPPDTFKPFMQSGRIIIYLYTPET